MRRVDLAEESYFNTDDEEDDDTPGPHPAPTSPLPLPPLHSPPLSRIQFAQKRRRQRTTGIPLRTGGGAVGTQRVPTPATPIHLPRTPPINALVDYRDDDEPSSDPEDALLESLVKPPASTSSVVIPTTTTTPAPTITTTTTTTTANTGTSSGGFVPLRAEKRRRAEEDEDESGLERLVSGKSRRPARVAASSTASGEEAPKRIRLRFGAASLAAAAASTLPTAARSEPGTKDGDTG